MGAASVTTRHGKRSSKDNRLFRPWIETLERRDLPSISLSGTTLVVSGDSSNDRIIISLDTAGPNNVADDKIRVTRYYGGHGAGDEIVNPFAETKSFARYKPGGLYGLVPSILRLGVNAKDGFNYVDNDTPLPMVAFGGKDDDELRGGSGKDAFYGGDGNDWLLGGGGDDRLVGMAGNDRLEGGSGDDRLEGREGFDDLYGGSGNDLLYGGADADNLFGGKHEDSLFGGGAAPDHLYGGAGYDRFLCQTLDGPHDVSSVDAAIWFHDSDEPTEVKGIEWSAKPWTDAEIESIDAAFGFLQRRTNNTKLLKDKVTDLDGNTLSFTRVGSPNVTKNTLGWNSKGHISITDNALNTSVEWLRQTVWHEIAHNWDNEGAFWDGFRRVSGWKKSSTNPDPGVYTRAAITQFGWWFKKSATFARDYGKTNPAEDFATSFERVMARYAKQQFEGTGAQAIPKKEKIINAFLDSVTW